MRANLARGGQRVALEVADERGETGVLDGPHVRLLDARRPETLGASAPARTP